MKLGFFTNAYRYFPFEFAMESISRYKYEGIELWAKGEHITPYDSIDQWQAIKNLVDAAGLEVYAVSAHLDFVAPEEEKRTRNLDKFLKVLDMQNSSGWTGYIPPRVGFMRTTPMKGSKSILWRRWIRSPKKRSGWVLWSVWRRSRRNGSQPLSRLSISSTTDILRIYLGR